jgi:hypothetical protein
MSTSYSPGLTVVVGDSYAKVLGYENSVGAMGIIDNVMSAMCGVFMLTGDSVGKQVDIHLQDCIVQSEEGKRYSAVVNFRTGNIYYTENRELLDYTSMCIGRSHSREFHDVSYMHEVLDFCEKEYAKHQEERGYDWIIHCLDDRDDEESRKYLETYEAEKACEASEQEAFQESKLKQMQLTASLLQQMNAQKKVDDIVKGKEFLGTFTLGDDKWEFRSSSEDDD